MQKLYTAMVALVLMALPLTGMATDTGVPRITKEELKAKMDKGADILILDVRTGGSYSGSKIKIKGAMRMSPDTANIRSNDLPKNKEIITYCT